MGAAPVLTILKGGETLRSVPIEGDAILGRSEDCVIRLEDRAISRQHALFSRRGDQVQVEKKSEFAPLKVNGADCSTAILKEGDVVSIGPYLLRLTIPDAEQNEPTVTAAQPVESTQTPVQNTGSGSVSAGFSPSPDEGTQVMLESNAVPSPVTPEEHAENASPVTPITNESDPFADFSLEQPEGASSEMGGASEPIEVMPELSLETSQSGQSGDPAQGASSQIAPSTEVAEATKVVQAAMPELRIVLKSGAANVNSYVLDKSEIVIGRGKDCDIVVGDKKASRKNSSISKNGLFCTIRDLGSSNGTYVNGEKVTEKELSGGDLLRIGDTEFELRAEKPGYSDQMKDFMPVPPHEETAQIQQLAELAPQAPLAGFQSAPADGLPVLGAPAPGEILDGPLADGIAALGSPDAQGAQADAGASSDGAVAPAPGQGEGGTLSNILGIAKAKLNSGKAKSIMEKYRALPKRTQYIVIVVVVVFIWWFLSDDDEVKKRAAPKPKTDQAQQAGAGAKKEVDVQQAKAFSQLTKEQQNFVRAQHQLAFDYYKNREYDKALFEIQKIFKYVDDYEDSREIERYSKEGKRKLEAIAEEKAKQEAEAVSKQKIADLLGQAKELMDKKAYSEAGEVFSQILALDPENAQVAQWQAKIHEQEEDKRVEAEKKQVQVEINKHAWEVYQQGVRERKEGRLRTALETFDRVKEIEAPDPGPAKAAAGQIKAIHAQIRAQLEPFLKAGKDAEDQGDFVSAMDNYNKALAIEPGESQANKGIDRLTGILTERAKALYTEAVLAESYSDFATAKSKYQDCLRTAPQGSIYHDRAERKLGRYFRQPSEEAPPQ